MQDIGKFVSKNQGLSLVIVVLVAALVYYFYQGGMFEGMESMDSQPQLIDPITGEQATLNPSDSMMPEPMASSYPNPGMNIAGVIQDNRNLPQFPDQSLKAQDLMPGQNDARFNQLYPGGDIGQLDGRNFLTGKKNFGIDTQAGSLRNPNYQLRSEPPNPVINGLSPWNQSTMEADTSLRQFEIGAPSTYQKPMGSFL